MAMQIAARFSEGQPGFQASSFHLRKPPNPWPYGGYFPQTGSGNRPFSRI